MEGDEPLPNMCVIGAGFWGKNLVKTFNDLGVLRAICDANPATLRAFEEAYPDVELIPRLEQVLDNSQIDSVAIAAPAARHFSLVRQSLEAGKHVFCEKPLALRAPEGRQLCELADSAQRVFMVGHLLEFHPVVEALKAMVSRGELGTLWYAYSNRLKFGRFRTEENVLWSFAPHDISILDAVLEVYPVGVSASGCTCLTHGVCDVALARFEYPGTLRSHVYVNWLNPFPERKFVVVGSERMAVFDDLAPEAKLQVFDTSIAWQDEVPVAKPLRGETIDTPGEPPLLAECRHFAECVESGTAPRTDGRSALRILQVLEACQASLEQEGMPVAIPPCFD